MKSSNRIEFINYCHEIAPEAQIIFMNPIEAVFEENVRMNCFYCGKYANNWRCPPNLPSIDYPKMFSEYDSGAFITYIYYLNDKSNYENIRTESSVTLHKVLLKLEKWMYDHNCSNAISFGAGSCKLCKGGCGKEKCNNPYMSRSPLEAIGVNVIKTVKKYGLDICFPADTKLMRVGLILWQESP